MNPITEEKDLVFRAEDLSKSYGKGTPPVLDHFHLEIPRGKIFGLLGPNGCGKSTLIKLTAGLLVPDGGKIYIDGKERSEESNAFISYLPERTYFQPDMIVEELIRYFADFYRDFDESAARKMLSDLGISTDERLKTLSKGTKEKVQLILVMARKAKLYLLDEPIGGVDPAARDYILSTILGNYNKDASIMITTHLIYDVEPVIDAFAFMGNGGRILLSGNAEEKRAEYGKSLNDIFREVFQCSGNH